MANLARGGFAPAASDVDLALVLSDLRPEDGAIVQEIGAAVKEEIKSPLGRRLSVFWSTWSSLRAGEGQGRFPLADRQDLALSGVGLLGADRRGSITLPSGPALGDALVIEGAAFMRDKLANPERNRLLRSPDELVALGRREVTKAVLFPARFLLTLDSGRAAGNEESAAFVSETRNGPVSALVTAAYQCRDTGELDPVAMARLLKAGLLPLYDELTEGYAVRLERLDETRLADAIRRWRADLHTIT